MIHTRPMACLSVGLLRYVRDTRPNETQLLEWLGNDASTYHVLRKANLLQTNDGHIELSSAHVSADGMRFKFKNKLFLLDEDKELVFSLTTDPI
jgi:hypothetical protein